MSSAPHTGGEEEEMCPVLLFISYGEEVVRVGEEEGEEERRGGGDGG